MSVPENKRKESKLEVLVKTLQVATYTNQILANKKKFDPMYDEVLGIKIRDAGQNVYRYSRNANDLRVQKPVSGEIDPEARDARKRLQDTAIQCCGELLILIDMAYGTYHLSAKRVEYWGKMVRDARALLRKWRSADKKRYGYP